MRRTILCALIGVPALFAHTATAAVLSDLVGKSYDPQDPTTYIQVGDKRFTNFGYSYTGDMPSANLINVNEKIDYTDGDNPITGTPIAWGIRFQGAFQDFAGGGASDALITYDILVVDPSQAISGAHIAANILVIGEGKGTITETFLPQEQNALLKVYNFSGTTDLVDDTSFLPNTWQYIKVQKDILLDAAAGGSYIGENETFVPNDVTMSYVDQTFYQVPEPASLSMLALGGAALLLRRKKA